MHKGIDIVKKLTNSFAIALLGLSAASLSPKTAEAGIVMTSGAIVSITAANTANKNRAALDNALANPTPETIAVLRDRGYVDDIIAPYVADAIAEMEIAPGTKPDDITPGQRDRFIEILREKRLTNMMSAETPEQAVAKGMDDKYSPYFLEGKKAYGYEGRLDARQSQMLLTYMEDAYFENDVKPTLIVAGAGAAVLYGGAFAYGYTRRRRPS